MSELKIRWFVSCAMLIGSALAAGPTGAGEADLSSAAQEKERKLIAVLQSSAPKTEKVKPRRIAIAD